MAAREEEHTAFIDLLATKQSLEIGTDAYQSALRLFRQGLRNNIHLLAARDRFFMFSDCAYIATTDLKKFASFVAGVRSDLLVNHLFYRGALVKGALEEESFAKDLTKNSLKAAHGFCFGPAAVRAFQLHEQTKGVAVAVSKEVELDKDLIVESHFSQSEKTIQIRQFIDFRMVFDDVSHEAESLDRLFREAKKQNTRSRRVGRYYLTPLLTWIRSVSFSDISYDATSRTFSRQSPILERLLTSPAVDELKALAGYEYVFFALAQKLHDDGADETTIRRLYDVIGARSHLRDRIGPASPLIISERIKNELLNYIIR